MDTKLMNPMPLTKDGVRALIMQMLPTLPPEITLEDMVPELIATIAEVSDRITMAETAQLLGVATALARCMAVEDPRLNLKIQIVKDTCQ